MFAYRFFFTKDKLWYYVTETDTKTVFLTHVSKMKTSESYSANHLQHVGISASCPFYILFLPQAWALMARYGADMKLMFEEKKKKLKHNHTENTGDILHKAIRIKSNSVAEGPGKNKTKQKKTWLQDTQRHRSFFKWAITERSLLGLQGPTVVQLHRLRVDNFISSALKLSSRSKT